MKTKETLTLLKEYSGKLDSVSYEEIFTLFRKIGHLPIPVAKLPAGSFIDRVRANRSTHLFKHVDELGHIKDPNVIRRYLTSYGRANIQHQSMFYGALKTELIDKPRLTAIAETSNLFRIAGRDSLDGEVFARTTQLDPASCHTELVEVLLANPVLNT